MEDELTPAQRGALEALKSTRGPCPSPEALVDYEALPENDRARRPEHAHVQLCSRCQLVMLHVQEPARLRAVALRRVLLPMAAVAVLALGFVLIDRRGGSSDLTVADTVRGTELQVTAPAGAVDIIREFRWQSPIQADRYRVMVRRGQDVIWQGETTGLSLAPPQAGVIERDVQYEWVVEAIDREGNVRMTSPPQPFVVY
jgi:hypothetical protein